ncbi:MAG: SDR family oxidoreductase [Gaiellales bacterium]
MQCLKRRVYPREFNRMVLFLASDDAGACTAQSYIVDAGRAGL